MKFLLLVNHRSGENSWQRIFVGWTQTVDIGVAEQAEHRIFHVNLLGSLAGSALAQISDALAHHHPVFFRIINHMLFRSRTLHSSWTHAVVNPPLGRLPLSVHRLIECGDVCTYRLLTHAFAGAPVGFLVDNFRVCTDHCRCGQQAEGCIQ